jgi:hypothetical protein
VKADARTTVTRAALLAAILVAMLVIAAPAFAFDGARNDFTPVATCAGCHDTGGFAPTVVPEWSMTGHASQGSYDPAVANAYPVSRGPSCAGCHAGNYTPSKAQGVKTPWPAPTPTATPTLYPPAIANQNPSGDSAYTMENFIDEGGTPHANAAVVGCSACHYNQSKAHSPFADDDLYGDMANADICGTCHDRYSVNKTSFPTLAVIPDGTAGTTTPQYPVAYNPYTTPLGDVMNIISPAAPGGGAFWSGGQSAKAHGEGAVQYPEWIQEGHANAMKGALPAIFGGIENVPDSCLECHSADYMIMEEADKWSDTSVPKFGVTCQACHTPHSEGPTKSTWNEERDPQLILPQTQLCNKCHNSEIPVDSTFAPGQEVHHPMREMMAGYGAIDVPQISSVHEGKCVQCHMVPTGYENSGAAGTSANHVFAIITPEEASEQTTTTSAGVKNMPYSSCSTCHGKAGDPLATYLQDTIVDRQAFIHLMVDKIHDELVAGADRMGYTSTDLDELYGEISAVAEPSKSETEWLKSWTNMEMVMQEGSWGIHNWAYANAIVNKALDQAKSVKASLASISIATNPLPTGGPPTYVPGPAITFPNTVAFGGEILPADQANLVGGVVKLWALRNGSTTWNVVASTFVEGDDSNEWVIDYVPRQNAIYKAQFAGNDTYESIVSSWTVAVDVRWQVVFKTSSGSVKKNKSVTYSGRVEPKALAIPLAATQKVVIQRKTSGTWKNWKSITLKADGSYSAKIKMTKKGKYVLRGFFAGDHDGATPPVYFHLDGWSASKTVTVK